MTLQEFQEKVKKIYNRYPQAIKEALFSFENSTIIRETAAKFKIDENILAQEVGFVLLGATEPNKMIERWQRIFSLSSYQAGALFREINRYIFFPLRREIVKAYQIAREINLSLPERNLEIEEKIPGKKPEIKKPEIKKEKNKERIETKVKEETFEGKLPKGKVIDLGKRKELSFEEKGVSPEEIAEIKKEIEKEKEKDVFPKIKIPKVISQQKSFKPIADIEKPKTSAEPIEETKEEDLFGKIEFPGSEKQRKKKINFENLPEVPPDFSEVSYSPPEEIKEKKLSPFKRIISFRKKKK